MGGWLDIEAINKLEGAKMSLEMQLMSSVQDLMSMRYFGYQKWRCLGYCVDITRRKRFESHLHWQLRVNEHTQAQYIR